PLLVASPVGTSIVALPTLGRAFAPLGATRSVGVRLFDTAAAGDTPVTVTTSDASVASATASVVHAGESTSTLQITTGAAGAATLVVEASGVRRELTIVVGIDPTPLTSPPVVSAPAGVVVIPNPGIGRVFGQSGTAATTTLGVTLFAA